MASLSLYIHIPFCAHICGYCDFAKVLYQKEWAFSYLDALIKEISSYGKRKYKTIYLGGGTPTLLPLPLLEKLLLLCQERLATNGEFTIEGNPEDINEELLYLCLKYGVNRLSLGVQSSSTRLLLLMGRKHTFEDAEKAFILAKKVGFKNLSADIIYGLPNETLCEVEKDINAFLSLDLPHLSAYCLSVSPGSFFYHRGIKEMNDEDAAKQYELILSSLRKKGYVRYEVSNFAKDGYFSRHNLTYWHDEEYVGVGLGASGYLDGYRYTNTKNLNEYLAGKYLFNKEKLTKKSEIEDYFLTNLRLERGFSLKLFEKRFAIDFKKTYALSLKKLKDSGLLVEENGYIHATDRGIMLLDRILLELF